MQGKDNNSEINDNKDDDDGEDNNGNNGDNDILINGTSLKKCIRKKGFDICD